MIDLLLYISVAANIATILSLVISIISLRKNIKKCEKKIDVLITTITKTGYVIDHSIINDLNIYGDVKIK